MRKLINLVAYIILLIVAVVVIIKERKDNSCPSFESTQKECDKGGPMCYSWTKPESTDTIDTVIDKIETCSKANSESVKWRRILITSIGIVVGLWATVSLFIDEGGLFLPDWRITYLCITVTYVILFSTFNYYDFHLYKGAENNIRENLKKIRKII